MNPGLARPSLPGAHALGDAISLLLRDPGEYGKQQLGGRRGRVEPRLLATHHSDPRGAELVEVTVHRPNALAAETIKSPNEEDAELAAMGTGKDVGKRGAITTSPARSVGVDGDDLEAEAFGPPPQLEFLVFRRLFSRADPDVDGRASHSKNSPLAELAVAGFIAIRRRPVSSLIPETANKVGDSILVQG